MAKKTTKKKQVRTSKKNNGFMGWLKSLPTPLKTVGIMVLLGGLVFAGMYVQSELKRDEYISKAVNWKLLYVKKVPDMKAGNNYSVYACRQLDARDENQKPIKPNVRVAVTKPKDAKPIFADIRSYPTADDAIQNKNMFNRGSNLQEGENGEKDGQYAFWGGEISAPAAYLPDDLGWWKASVRIDGEFKTFGPVATGFTPDC